MSQRSRFRGPFDKQPSKSAQVILKSTPQYLYHIDWSWQSQLSWKKSLLLPWIRRKFPQATWHTCPSTVEICITASLLYSLITAKFKKSSFRVPLDKQHRRRPQALVKSASQDLFHIIWSLPSRLNWKKSLLLICKILGLLVNTLAADEKYPVLNRDNLTILIQMQLSEKEKTFS